MSLIEKHALNLLQVVERVQSMVRPPTKSHLPLFYISPSLFRPSPLSPPPNAPPVGRCSRSVLLLLFAGARRVVAGHRAHHRPDRAHGRARRRVGRHPVHQNGAANERHPPFLLALTVR